MEIVVDGTAPSKALEFDGMLSDKIMVSVPSKILSSITVNGTGTIWSSCCRVSVMTLDARTKSSPIQDRTNMKLAIR